MILLLVDGLWWLRLQKWMQSPAEEFAVWKYLEQNNQLVPITSITPSTTCAALTTLNTGESPAAHGNLAYELWLKEFGVVANMITHTPMRFQGEAGSLKKIGIQPAEFLPVPTLDSHFISNGITVEALHPAAISHSSLTAMLFPMARLHSYFSLGDLWYQLRDAIKNSGNHSSYVFAYWSAVDELSHLYGPDDMRVQQAFRELSWYLTDLWKNPFKSDRKKTLLIITADHGLQATPVNETYNLNKHKAFLDCLVILPTEKTGCLFCISKPEKKSRYWNTWQRPGRGNFCLFQRMKFCPLVYWDHSISMKERLTGSVIWLWFPWTMLTGGGRPKKIACSDGMAV